MLRAAGRFRRLAAFLRLRLVWLWFRLDGVGAVVLDGRVYPVRALPLGKSRVLIPAVIRCSRAFAEWRLDDDDLYQDLVTVLSVGLGTSRQRVEGLHTSLFALTGVIRQICEANGLPMVEEGTDPGKLMALMMSQTGTSST